MELSWRDGVTDHTLASGQVGATVWRLGEGESPENARPKVGSVGPTARPFLWGHGVLRLGHRWGRDPEEKPSMRGGTSTFLLGFRGGGDTGLSSPRAHLLRTRPVAANAIEPS